MQIQTADVSLCPKRNKMKHTLTLVAIAATLLMASCENHRTGELKSITVDTTTAGNVEKTVIRYICNGMCQVDSDFVISGPDSGSLYVQVYGVTLEGAQRIEECQNPTILIDTQGNN